ncbi:uncharacterized protein LOC115396016 isoform X1 [Salarias fasciatus]|uniref:uncharacterized protein LOC115396016 isoform X1 n=1 Tax=Salarias fasciatus TaxID=181472 RepID=UPI001176A85C|nr:uncharacterized protein LOC115396016 isoform X1 [Salarias fasciatus]
MSTAVLMMIIMMMVVKSEAEVVEVWISPEVTSVKLESGLQTKQYHEVRWTYKDMLVRTNETSVCDSSRCQLLSDGSLMLNHITHRYAGNYKMEAFDSQGRQMYQREFRVRVNGSSAASQDEDPSTTSSVTQTTTTEMILDPQDEEPSTSTEPATPGQDASGSGPSFAGRSAAICCSVLLLLLLFIALFILVRKKNQMKSCSNSGHMENEYVVMHRGKINQQEEDIYVSCEPAVSRDTDIYV